MKEGGAHGETVAEKLGAVRTGVTGDTSFPAAASVFFLLFVLLFFVFLRLEDSLPGPAPRFFVVGSIVRRKALEDLGSTGGKETGLRFAYI